MGNAYNVTEKKIHMCVCFIILTVSQTSQIIGIGRKKSWKERDKNVNSCHILAENFFMFFLNAAFSKILNEFGQLSHYKKIQLRDLIGDP